MTLIEELSAQILVTPFVELEPHLKRGAVILISEDIDLAQTAAWIAEDNKQEISRLLAQGLLTKPTLKDLETWRQDKRFFRMLIVQPFVVAQNFTALSPRGN